MPEGPELHLTSLYVNKVCDGMVFTGPVQKSEVSKCPDVPFTCEAYRITATSRGKEVKLTLTPIKSADWNKRVKTGQADQPMDIVFRFGMSENPCRVLSFVDTRRFGSWQPSGTWQPNRGPCVMFEYSSFRENIVSHLSDRAFDRPICEVLLNQKYFNGIGNYLRAEILYRLNIPPFVSARSVLEGLEKEDSFEKKPVKSNTTGKKTSSKAKKTEERRDLLRMCHVVPLEVVNLGGKGYDPAKVDYSGFEAWLQCYSVGGMKSLQDHSGRTIWFKGDPGPMAPKGSKSRKAKIRVKKESDHDYTNKKKEMPETKEKDAHLREAGSGRKRIEKPLEVCTAPKRKARTLRPTAEPRRKSSRVAEKRSK